jgi:hypothetical protein
LVIAAASAGSEVWETRLMAGFSESERELGELIVGFLRELWEDAFGVSLDFGLDETEVVGLLEDGRSALLAADR